MKTFNKTLVSVAKTGKHSISNPNRDLIRNYIVANHIDALIDLGYEQVFNKNGNLIGMQLPCQDANGNAFYVKFELAVSPTELTEKVRQPREVVEKEVDTTPLEEVVA